MQQREPVTSLLLALFVPFYLQYWLYKTAEEVRSTHNVKSMPKGIVLILPPIVVFILWPISFILTLVIQGNSGSVSAGPQVFLLLLSLLFSLVILGLVVVNIILVYRFCKSIVQVVNVGLTHGILTLLFFALPPLVVYLVQEKLNHLTPNNTQPSSPSPSPL